MPATYEDTIIPGLEPTIKRRYITGDEFTFTGDRAMALADTPGAEEWRINNPQKAIALGKNPLDEPSGLFHSIGKHVRDFSEKNGIFGKIADKGTVPGALAGGAIGAGAGALANVLAKFFFPGAGSAGRWAIAGGILGSILGGHNGWVRATAKEKGGPFLKSAATYTDPRNFILEKLQGATDVSMLDKVKLAAGVKNLDRDSAEKLAALVRSALGFGIGAIISKFIFGASGAGALFGGLGGMFGANFLVNNFVKKQPSSPFDFNFRPLSYRDIL